MTDWEKQVHGKVKTWRHVRKEPDGSRTIVVTLSKGSSTGWRASINKYLASGIYETHTLDGVSNIADALGFANIMLRINGEEPVTDPLAKEKK